ncbi:uncharacterized protein LOC121981742 isoform X2 [Zingiber officinale]|uniref:uncharacterized protein LOC121981742 isoform X2 n=1 Tax=Zingiber officinale TaxID=94328 RepID=UPI001C4AB774|nr:uncharacterized protein LOC121981742 isoform X2 [Zingiber officinale]
MKGKAISGEFLTQEHHVKGSEIFIGGLSRSVTESDIHELFSPYGMIIELRMMKDQDGNSKGFCFVRFGQKESASRAIREKDGFVLHGKSMGVDFSSDQDSLFFGNLRKDWSLEEFEKLVHQAFKDVISVNLPMSPIAGDSMAGKRRLNRGFAFVHFSSHAAAARAHRIGSKPDFLLDGNWHPVIDWVEKDPEIDPEELAKIKTAYVGNLPKDADEDYLRKMFDPLGKIEKVAVSRKGPYPVGFVHFARRLDLDYAIREMDGQIVQGPYRGPKFKIQVAVARPVVMGKRPRVELKSKSPSEAGVLPHSYEDLTSDSFERKSKALRLTNQAYDDGVGPYEATVITLPAAVKERLLRLFRRGIATRFDLDLGCITSLKELPGSLATAILDQFMISGADKRDKRAYFLSLLSKVDRFARGNPLYQTQKSIDYLPEESELTSLPAPVLLEEIDHPSPRISPPARYASNSSLYDSPPRSRQSVGRLIEAAPSSYSRPISPARYRSAAGSSIRLAPEKYPAERRQIRFDPFTGEPYKFDPFTGELIGSEPRSRHSGSYF